MPGALSSVTCPLPCKLRRARLAAESASEPPEFLFWGRMCHVESPCQFWPIPWRWPSWQGTLQAFQEASHQGRLWEWGITVPIPHHWPLTERGFLLSIWSGRSRAGSSSQPVPWPRLQPWRISRV